MYEHLEHAHRCVSTVTEVSETQVKQLLVYLGLLQKWNKAYNLTAITDSKEMIRLHLADSASAATFIEGDTVLDVGTGAGLPGLVLAVLQPDKQFTLLDSNNKKIRFLRQCQTELGLENISPIHARAEEYHAQQMFSTVVSRAFASLDDFIEKCAHHLTEDGVLLAMKGHWPEPVHTTVAMRVNKIVLPEAAVTRHMVVIKKADL